MFTKSFLGKKDLNNFCKSSKEAGIGSDAGFLFPPFIFYVYFAKMPCSGTSHSAFASACKPVEHLIALPRQHEFSDSRAASASMAGENTYQGGNNGIMPAAPDPPASTTLLTPLLEINKPQHLIQEPYLPYSDRSHTKTVG